MVSNNTGICKGFYSYLDKWGMLEDLSNEQLGLIYRQEYIYCLKGEILDEIAEDKLTKMAWAILKPSLDNNLAKSGINYNQATATPIKQYIEDRPYPQEIYDMTEDIYRQRANNNNNNIY